MVVFRHVTTLCYTDRQDLILVKVELQMCYRQNGA